MFVCITFSKIIFFFFFFRQNNHSLALLQQHIYQNKLILIAFNFTSPFNSQQSTFFHVLFTLCEINNKYFPCAVRFVEWIKISFSSEKKTHEKTDRVKTKQSLGRQTYLIFYFILPMNSFFFRRFYSSRFAISCNAMHSVFPV